MHSWIMLGKYLFGPWASLVSVIKTTAQEHLGGGKCLFGLYLHVIVQHWGKAGQELKAGTWRQELKQKPWVKAAYWPANHGLLSLLPSAPYLSVSLCRPGWSQTQRDPPASASCVLGLKVGTTNARLIIQFLMLVFSSVFWGWTCSKYFCFWPPCFKLRFPEISHWLVPQATPQGESIFPQRYHYKCHDKWEWRWFYRENWRTLWEERRLKYHFIFFLTNNVAVIPLYMK